MGGILMTAENKRSWFGKNLNSSSNTATPLSGWWIFGLCVAMIVGFTTLITLTCLAYVDKPPIPEQVVDTSGNTVFTGSDIRQGQEIFLSKGLMSNGTVWGHGSYLGPDFPALTLHRIGEQARNDYAFQFNKTYDQLSTEEKGAVDAKVIETIKAN